LESSAYLRWHPGPGTAAKILAYFFPHVVVSDAGQNNVESSKAYLRPAENFTFKHSPAEQECLSPQSVDFAAVCMAMHYMDEEAAVRTIAKSLRLGGTFAAVTYSFMLKFPERPRLAEIWFDVLSHESDRFVKMGRLFPAAIKGCSKAMSGLDFVPLPEDLFEPGAVRMQINVTEGEEHPFLFVRPSADSFMLPEKKYGASDVVKYARDDGWRKECDVEWLKGFLISCHLGFGDQTWKMDSWKEFESIVRDAGGEVTVEWPVAIILATRART
jgi:trans-aconitate 3-methyltransferase